MQTPANYHMFILMSDERDLFDSIAFGTCNVKDRCKHVNKRWSRATDSQSHRGGNCGKLSESGSMLPCESAEPSDIYQRIQRQTVTLMKQCHSPYYHSRAAKNHRNNKKHRFACHLWIVLLHMTSFSPHSSIAFDDRCDTISSRWPSETAFSWPVIRTKIAITLATQPQYFLNVR
jgi:hypothetical protein